MAQCFEDRYDIWSRTYKKVAVPCPDTGANPKTKDTNKYGGPKGTKKNASGDPYSVHKGKGGSTGGDAKTPKSKAEPEGVSAAEQQSIADSRKAAEEAAAAAAKAEAERIAARVLKKAKISQQDLQKDIDANEAKRQAILERNAAALTALDEARATGNAGRIITAEAEVERTRGELLKVEVDDLDNRGRALRRNEYDKIQAENEIIFGTEGSHAQNKAQEKSGSAVDHFKKVRENYGDRSPILDQTKADTGKKKPGDIGFQRKLDEALALEVTYQANNPKDYEPDKLTPFGEAEQKHIDTVVKTNNRLNKQLTQLTKEYNDPDTTPERRKAILKKHKALLADSKANRKEAKIIFGTDDKLWASGAVRKKGRKGSAEKMAAQFDWVYDAAAKYQNDLVAAGELPSFIRGVDPADISPLIRAANEDRAVIWDGSLTDKNGKTVGGYREQEPVERLIELFASGEGEALMREWQERGQAEVIDIQQRTVETLDNPNLRHLYDVIGENGISDASDLTGSEGAQRREDIIDTAVDRAMAEYRLTDEYAENVPTTSNPQYFDLQSYDLSYGRDPDKPIDVGASTSIDTFVAFNVPGVGPVRPEEWLPEYGPEPPWDVVNSSLALDGFANTADVLYDVQMQQRIEDEIRGELRVDDPGALGDAMRTGVGTTLQGFGLILYEASVIARGTSGGNFGFNFVGAPTDDIGKDVDAVDNEGWLQDSIIPKDMLEDAYASDGTGRYVQPPTLGLSDGNDPSHWENLLNFAFGPVMTVIDDTVSGERVRRFTIPFADQLPINIEFTHRTSPEIRGELQQELYELANIVGSSGAPVEDARKMVEEAKALGDPALIAAAEDELAAVIKSGKGTFLGTGHGISLSESGGRVRILTEHGEFFTEGNLAGIGNFMMEMAIDPTNFLPFLTIAKRGLNGVMAAHAAGKIPASSKSLKLARMAEEFRAGASRNPRIADELAGFDDSLAKLLNRPEMDEVDRILLLKQALTGMKLPDDPAEHVGFIADLLRKKSGFDELGVDPALLKNWVEEELYIILRERHNILDQSPELAAKQMTNAKAFGNAKAAKRSRSVREAQKLADEEERLDKVARAEKRAAKAEADAKAAAKKADDLKKKKAPDKPKEGDAGTVPGSGGTLTSPKPTPHAAKKAAKKKAADAAAKRSKAKKAARDAEEQAKAARGKSDLAARGEAWKAAHAERRIRARKPRSIEQLRGDVDKELRALKTASDNLKAGGGSPKQIAKTKSQQAAAQKRLDRALERGQIEYGVDLTKATKRARNQRPVAKGQTARVTQKPFEDEALTEGVQRGATRTGIKPGSHRQGASVGGPENITYGSVKLRDSMGLPKASASGDITITGNTPKNIVVDTTKPSYMATEGTDMSPLHVIDEGFDGILPDHQLELPDNIIPDSQLEYKEIWDFEPTGSVKFREEEDILNQNTRMGNEWDPSADAWNGVLSVDQIPFHPDSYIRETPEAMYFRARLSHSDARVRAAAYTRLFNMAKQEWGEMARLSPDKIPHDFDRTLLGITDDVSRSRAAYEAAAVRHTIAEGRKQAAALQKNTVEGAPKSIEPVSPYHGAVTPLDEAGQAIADDLGENINPFIASNTTGDFYQAFRPWDPKTPVLKSLPATNAPEAMLEKLLNIFIDPDNRKAVFVNGDDTIVAVLSKGRTAYERLLSTVKGLADNPVEKFRYRNQLGYDLFHGLLKDAEVSGDYGFELLSKMHDDVFEAAFDAGTGRLIDDDLLVNWLLMEARAGMPFALPHDVIEKIAMDLMAKNGILPHEGIRMFNPTYSARYTARHLRIDPSIRGLFSGRKPRSGGEASWSADPPPSWLKTHGDAYWRESWDNLYTKTFGKAGAHIAEVTQYASAFFEAQVHRFGKWHGSPSRTSMLSRNSRSFAENSFEGSKFTSRKAEREVKNLFVTYIDDMGGLPDFWRLERGGKAIRSEKTGDVVALGSKKAYDMGVRAPAFDEFMDALRTGDVGKGGKSTRLHYQVFTSYEKAIANGTVTPQNPAEATFAFLADRQFQGGGSYLKSSRYLDYMDAQGLGDEARDLLTNLYEGSLKNFEAELGMNTHRGGAALDDMLEGPKGQFFRRLVGKDSSYFKAKALNADRPDIEELSDKAADMAERNALRESQDAANLGVHKDPLDQPYGGVADDLVNQHLSVIDDTEALAAMEKMRTLREHDLPVSHKPGVEKKTTAAMKRANKRYTSIVDKMLNAEEIVPENLRRYKEARKLADEAGLELDAALTDAEWKLIKDLQKRAYSAQKRVYDALLADNTQAGDWDTLRELAQEMLTHPAYGGAPSVKRAVRHLSENVRGTPLPSANQVSDSAYRAKAVQKIVDDAKTGGLKTARLPKTRRWRYGPFLDEKVKPKKAEVAPKPKKAEVAPKPKKPEVQAAEDLKVKRIEADIVKAEKALDDLEKAGLAKQAELEDVTKRLEQSIKLDGVDSAQAAALKAEQATVLQELAALGDEFTALFDELVFQEAKLAKIPDARRAEAAVAPKPKKPEVQAAEDLKVKQKDIQKAYDEGDIKKGQKLQEEAEDLSAAAKRGGLQDTEVLRIEADIAKAEAEAVRIEKLMEPKIKEYDVLFDMGKPARGFDGQSRYNQLLRELRSLQEQLDAAVNEAAFQTAELAKIPDARRAEAAKAMVDETLDDAARQEAKAVEKALDPEEPPLPPEEFREVPLGGPEPDFIAHTRASVLANDAGLTEEQWLKEMHNQNKNIINNRKSTPEARAAAKADNRQIARAVRNIRMERYNKKYRPPKTRYDDAMKAGADHADDVKGIIPPKMIAYFARTPKAMMTEMARSIHVMMKTRPIRQGGLVGLRKFQAQHWETITDHVTEAIREVQPKRTSSIGLRTVKDEALEQTDEADNLLKTRTDGKPKVLRAKKKALRDIQNDLGIPLADQLNINEYDRVRTLLQPHIGRKNRGMALLADIKSSGDQFREDFLARRKETADANAEANVGWTMLENPGMSAEDAVEHLKTSWYTDGTIRYDPVEITVEDASVLRRMFEHTTGANMDNTDEVVAALGADGTLPPMANKHRFRTHQEDTGEWSPRALDDVQEKGAWSIEAETAWWMARYGQAPRWLTDERVLSGAALKDRALYLAVMRETGNYDEAARLARELGSDDAITLKDMAHGNDSKSLSAMKSTSEERQYMIQRYGKIVSDDGVTLKECPWLMNSDEIAAYEARNAIDGEIPGVIKNVGDKEAIESAVKQVATKYADAHKAIKTVNGEVIIDPETVNLMALEAVRELAHTKPWQSALQTVKTEGKMGLGRRFLTGWRNLWTISVVSNPAFTLVNATDIPLRGGWFGITDPLARAGIRVSKATKEKLKTIDALGLGESHAFSHGYPKRPMLDRIRNGYSKMDKALGIADGFLTGLSRAVLPRVEDATKLRIGRQLYEGMINNSEMLAYKAQKGLSDDEFDLFVRIQVKKRVNKWFPTLSNAGPAEKLLNAVFPFTSYYAKNQIIWIGEMLDHPWALNTINHWNEALVEHNMAEWDRDHPNNKGRLPESLRHQIKLPFSDITDGIEAPTFLDIGTFIDATRGMQLLTSKSGGLDYSGLLAAIFRPLPSQVAFLKDIAWRGTNKWAFGRTKFVRKYDENGFWDGVSYDEIEVPPGTPWGDDGFDYLRDIVWGVDFMDAMTNSEMGFGNKLFTIAAMATFGSISRPSQYFMLNQQYFMLADTDELAAKNFLNSEAGIRLQKMWDENADKPTDVVINPYAVPYGPDSPIPDPKDIRARWLKYQEPEMRQELFQTFNDATVMNAYWDTYMDGLEDHEMHDAWTERNTFFNGYYAEHPSVPFYWGMGMDKNQFADWQDDFITDTEVGEFFSLFDWDEAPSWDFPKKRKEWEEQRQSYIDAHPRIKKFLAESKSAFDKQRDLINKGYAIANKLLKQANIMRDAAYAADNLKGVKAANMLMQGTDIAFSAEAFGDDVLPPENGEERSPKFKWSPDRITRALKRANGDPDEIAKAQYGQRMAGAIRQATKKDGSLDPLKFYRLIDKHDDLKAQYLGKHPKKRETWEVHGKYLEMWARFGRLADKGLWDQAWAAYDNAPAAVKEYMKEKMPAKFRKWEMDSRYNAYMGHWVGLFDQGRGKEAMAYFNSLPSWAKERYYSNHGGSTMSSGQSTQYVSNLNAMFSQIDAGNWDAAEKIWNDMPAWMRRRYYANNPDSTLFKGKGGSSGDSGGWSDKKYRTYLNYLDKHAALMKDGKRSAADKYYNSLPKWVRDTHQKNNPDKALLKESLRMQTLIEDYLIANKAEQQAMLVNNPDLARWINDNDADAAWANAIQFAYSQLTDPWQKRVFKEKYPEIFSDEAVGQAKIDTVMDTLGENPELVQPWLRWYKHIAGTLEEAMKYANARPKNFEISRERREKMSGHGVGRSAQEVAEQRVKDFIGTSRTLNKRLPQPEG